MIWALLLLQVASSDASGVAVVALLESRGAQGNGEVLSAAQEVHRQFSGSMKAVLSVKELRARMGVAERGMASCECLRKTYRLAYEQAYRFEQKEALVALEGLLGGIARCPESPAKWLLWIDSQVLIAKARLELSDRPGGMAAFSEVLRARPGHKLDPAEYSPAIRNLLEEARKVPISRGQVTITTQPKGAVVRLDGVKVGRSPYKGAHPVGEYRVHLSNGPLVVERQVRVGTSGLKMDLDLVLEAALEAHPFPALVGKERRWKALGKRLGTGRLATVERRQGHWRAALVDLVTGEAVRAGWVKTNESEAARVMARFLANGDLQEGKVLLNLVVPAFFAPGTIGEAKAEAGQ
ncbi:MAG TPA: PEGA domain-containing protein [Verrucomicrobiota bacterium]|nr:PEGA domain-containing protein [Verrucomicrobiota bacterium]